MRKLLLLLLVCIGWLAKAQEPTIGSNLVILCGPQDVYDKSDGSSEYKKTYTWPAGTYTLFKVKKEAKIIEYYSVSAAMVNEVTAKYAASGDIIKAIMEKPLPSMVVKYEILEALDPVKGIDGHYIMGYLYPVKLSWQSDESASTTVELTQGWVHVTAKGADGTPFKTSYPILHSEGFVYRF